MESIIDQGFECYIQIIHQQLDLQSIQEGIENVNSRGQDVVVEQVFLIVVVVEVNLPNVVVERDVVVAVIVDIVVCIVQQQQQLQQLNLHQLPMNH